MTSSEDEPLDEETGWPLSNYPILAAILLLAAAAAALALGYGESYANQLAVWAYYSLVAGVGMRVLELSISEEMREWLSDVFKRVTRVEDLGPGEATFFKELAGYLAAALLVAAGYVVLVDSEAWWVLPFITLAVAVSLVLHLRAGGGA